VSGDYHLNCDNPECNCIPCGYCRSSNGFMLYSMAKMVVKLVVYLRVVARYAEVDALGVQIATSGDAVFRQKAIERLSALALEGFT